jgi:tetratricopeptide (TPR) repeat protein
LDDKTKSVLLRCARVYISTKSWDKALSEYRVLYADFPDDPLIVEPLARANYETGNKFAAKELYEKALRIYADKGDAVKADRIKMDIAKMFPGN